MRPSHYRVTRKETEERIISAYYHFADHSYDATADRFGISVSTVRRLVFRHPKRSVRHVAHRFNLIEIPNATREALTR